jgi:hypothetical protein
MTGLLKRLGIVTTMALALLACGENSPQERPGRNPTGSSGQTQPLRGLHLRDFNGIYQVIKKERLDENGNVEWSYDWKRKVQFTRGREVPNKGMANEYFKLDRRNVTWRIGLDFEGSQERLPPFSVQEARPLGGGAGIYRTWVKRGGRFQDFKIRETDQGGIYTMDMLPAAFDETLRFTLEEMK